MSIWLFAVLFGVPLVFGIAGLRIHKIISQMCGWILFVLGAYLGFANSLTVGYHYNTSTGAWVTRTVTLPATPWPQIIICLLGIMLILSSSFGFREG